MGLNLSYEPTSYSNQVVPLNDGAGITAFPGIHSLQPAALLSQPFTHSNTNPVGYRDFIDDKRRLAADVKSKFA
jgi:hypothetical protein